jgi:hypothetical protein
MACKNKNGQTLTFDSSGYSQFGYDKDGYDEFSDFNANQVATCSNSTVSSSATPGSGGGRGFDLLDTLLSNAGNVWVSSNNAQAAQANAQAAIANNASIRATGINAGQPAGSGKTLLFIGIGVLLIAGVVIAVSISKSKGASAKTVDTSAGAE